MNGRLRHPDMTCRKATLANGLSVMTRRQGNLPIVAVNLWYHVGSKDEDRRQRGFAHLFEHLMFEGSQHFPGDFFKPLQRLGASLNGSTSADRTNYFEDLPAAHLEMALAMESDRMANLLPALDESKLRIQKDVVKNEYRQNYANRPYGLVWSTLAEAVYPPWHPYSWLTIGSMEDVEAASLDDVHAFFRRFYVPANASLAIVGDIDENQALDLADRYFGAIPGGSRAIPPWAQSAPIESTRAIVLHDRVELDRTYEVWPSVPHFHPDDAPLTLLADILTRGKSSRLYRELVVDRQIAQDVATYQSPRQLAGTFGAVATLRPGRDPQDARDRITAQITDLAQNGPTEAELDRVRNGRLAGFIYALDNVGGFGGVADRLNAYNIYRGRPDGFHEDLDRFQNTQADRIQDVARRYLQDRPSVRLTVLGRKPAPTTASLDRSQPPKPAEPVAYRPPSAQVLRLGCGATLWALPRRDLPIVAATLVVPAGASAHGPDLGGLASLTADLMDEGTHQRSSAAIAMAAERLGTVLSSSSGWDGSYVGFQCLSPHLDESLAMAVEVLLEPSFPEAEWERIQGQTLAALRAERDSAEARAQRQLLRCLYPSGHPYRVPVDGDLASTSALDRASLAAFHAAYYRPEGAAWVVAGDIDPEALARRLDDAVSGWTGTPTARPELETPAGPDQPRLVLLDRPGSAQAVIRAGHVGIRRLDADYHEVLILNQVLGGLFTSRLNARLREEKGLTYGIRSHFDMRRAAGPFHVGASVQTDRVAEAVAELRRELEALAFGERPVTPAELNDARRSLIEGQARHFETPSALVSRYAGLHLYGLPPDHHASFADRLQSVEIDRLSAAARRQIQPDRLVVVVVADAETVAEPLRRLGWGPVEIVDDRGENAAAVVGKSPQPPGHDWPREASLP